MNVAKPEIGTVSFVVLKRVSITHGNLKENIDFDIRRFKRLRITLCRLFIFFTLFVKEYNRPILTHNVIGLYMGDFACNG